MKPILKKIMHDDFYVKIIELTAFSQEIKVPLNRADIYHMRDYGLVTKKINNYQTINYENLCQSMEIAQNAHEYKPTKWTKTALKRFRRWVKVFRLQRELSDFETDEKVEKILNIKKKTVKRRITFQVALEKFRKANKIGDLEQLNFDDFMFFLEDNHFILDEYTFLKTLNNDD
ncbi:hypothetical protein [Halarcobacter anaerophilus]|uniref:Uncharacterized protein n=1 Tax=Halarcobacter anaerophilus TaxID=877500 RepID=A0A4Q0XZW7_9BACT|nr:hypothetical protein [Halarcobacter anaerophilus]QDF29921.1 hypothetical protein AANAER_2465 [Halarcobacter anaerophilus]RXJ62883.1 hypothetical protein CRV06_08595 [Halarcobacter anaerophilus]